MSGLRRTVSHAVTISIAAALMMIHTSAFGRKLNDQDRERLIVAKVAECVVQRKPTIRRAVLAGDEGALLSPTGGVVVDYFEKVSGRAEGQTLSLPLGLLPSIADVLVRLDVHPSAAFDFSGVEPLRFPFYESTLDKKNGQSNGSYAKRALEARRKIALMNYAECVARAYPSKVYGLLVTEVETVDEDQKLAMLESDLSRCRSDQSSPLARGELRSALAFSFYRLARLSATRGIASEGLGS